MNLLRLKDGRNLAYDVYGDQHGQPVIFNHGLSDSRLIRNPDESLLKSLNLCVIAADQPGVGSSSPMPNRRMIDWGSDMEELADHLKIKKFAVAGHSGGSPHALSVAFHMPKRVTKIALASPVADFSEPGITKLLRSKDLKLIVRLSSHRRLIKMGYAYASHGAIKSPTKFLRKTAKADLSDKATFFREPLQQKMFEHSFAAGMAQSGEGVMEMTYALWDWGFSLEDIKKPVALFYGDNDDIIDPRMPQLVGQRLPKCKVKVWHNTGHYGFVDDEHWLEFFGSLK